MNIKSALRNAIFAILMFAAPAMAADYKIDKAGQHAFITFKASHLGYSYIVGGFNDFDGFFSYDSKNPAASSAEVTINSNSLDSNHAERDKNLLGSDFLDVNKYPTITFQSSAYTVGASTDILTGELTILGITNEIAIIIKHVGEGSDLWGGYRSGFRGNVTLDSAAFGLPGWVGDIEVELNIEGLRI